jgi:hypothetical protein
MDRGGLLADASVARNFAVLHWTDHLVSVAGGILYIAHGVLGLHGDEAGEIEGIRAALERESVASPGSPEPVPLLPRSSASTRSSPDGRTMWSSWRQHRRSSSSRFGRPWT